MGKDLARTARLSSAELGLKPGRAAEVAAAAFSPPLREMPRSNSCLDRSLQLLSDRGSGTSPVGPQLAQARQEGERERAGDRIEQSCFPSTSPGPQLRSKEAPLTESVGNSNAVSGLRVPGEGPDQGQAGDPAGGSAADQVCEKAGHLGTGGWPTSLTVRRSLLA